MAVVSGDIKFYNSLATDGGDIDINNEITSGVLHELLGPVTATESELGVTKYVKFFVKNTNATDTAFAAVIGLSKFSLGDDHLELYKATSAISTTGTETFGSMRAFGVAHATGELDRGTRTIAIEFEDPTTATALFQSNDKVTFYNPTTGEKILSATVNTCSATQLIINQDIDASVVLNNSYVASDVLIGDLAAGASQGIWVKQVVKPYSAKQLNNTSRLTFYFDPAN